MFVLGGLALLVLLALTHGGFHRQTTSPRAALAARPLTSIMGVLRRQQNALDIPVALNAFLVNEAHTNTYEGTLGTPITSLIRFTIVSSWGQHIYLMPNLPPTTRQIASLAPKLQPSSPPKVVSFVFYPYVTLGVTRGLTAGDVRRGRAWAGVSGPGRHDRVLFAFPDGVARVKLWPAGSSTPIMLTVARNVAAFTTENFPGPRREIWYGPSGRVIKRIADASAS
jgi:hypothetical protein